jgi:repressor LexA
MNDRAQQILAFIQKFNYEKGYPPTIREIGTEFGIRSTNGVRYHLDRLQESGQLTRHDKISRGIEVRRQAPTTPLRASSGIPILGRVAAGEPIFAEQSLDGALEAAEMFGDRQGLFALRVRGDSMIEAGILDGDFVIVHSQDRAEAGAMVVALVEDEATVKYYRPRGERVELEPANANYKPLVVEREAQFRILGTVRGVLRTVGR